MASVQLNVRISSEESDHLEELAQQTEGILSKQGVVRLLIQHAQRSGWNPLDTPVTLDRRAAASLSKSSSSSSSKKRINTVSLLEQISVELAPHKALIEEFWKAKKGSKGETAWNLLITNLQRIHAKYGATVLAEQLQLGINGKWQSITLRNLENFSGKGPTAAQPVTNHPAYRVFTADNGFDEPKTGGVLDGLL